MKRFFVRRAKVCVAFAALSWPLVGLSSCLDEDKSPATADIHDFEKDGAADDSTTGTDDAGRDGGARDGAATDGGATDGGDSTNDATAPLPTPPADLVKCLDSKPYVEGTCSSTTATGWPHEAKACSYPTEIGTLHVTVANASAEQVAIWIMDAGDSLPAIAHLKATEPAKYLRVLQGIASALMLQSGRIFPIEGDVGEDLGYGYTAFHFKHGVTTTCPAKEPGCYCRINSLTRGDYCSYRAHIGVETESACRSRVNYGSGATTGWLSACLANHADAWGKAKHDGIRAQIWARIQDFGVKDDATGAQVVKAFDQAYGINDGTIATFCK